MVLGWFGVHREPRTPYPVHRGPRTGFRLDGVHSDPRLNIGLGIGFERAHALQNDAVNDRIAVLQCLRPVSIRIPSRRKSMMVRLTVLSLSSVWR